MSGTPTLRCGGWLSLTTIAVLAAGCSGSPDPPGRRALRAGNASVGPTTGADSSNSAPPANSATKGPERTAPATPRCVNAAVTVAVRTALVEANRQPGGQAVPGHTYYGTCGPVAYAVARFEPAPHATLAEQVSFQDDGSDTRFFMRQAGSAWMVVGRRQYDLAPTCATFTQLPSALKTLWQNCPHA